MVEAHRRSDERMRTRVLLTMTPPSFAAQTIIDHFSADKMRLLPSAQAIRRVAVLALHAIDPTSDDFAEQCTSPLSALLHASIHIPAIRLGL